MLSLLFVHSWFVAGDVAGDATVDGAGLECRGFVPPASRHVTTNLITAPRHMSPAATLVDIGLNLAHDSFDRDREDVIAAALRAGVRHMVITGSTLESHARRHRARAHGA